MITDRTLGLAVERALITADQADRLRAIAREPEAEPATETAADDDEALRFVTGFADIFVTIGIALFIGALFAIVESVGTQTLAFSSAAAAAWLLAEFFTRRRRMALPSIALLVVFVCGAFGALLSSLALILPDGSVALSDDLGISIPTSGLALLVAGLVTVGFAGLHYVRFRVPITVAAGMAALCLAFLGLTAIVLPTFSLLVLNGLILACGVVTFALAMRFDLSDPMRVTRRTDIAFWLHLLASPLIVHTLIRGFLHGLDELSAVGAFGVLAVFVVLGIVAVIIDRRAILVSGLAYAGFAFFTLIKTFGFAGSSLTVPVVLLVLGALVLILSAGWSPLRRSFLRLLPAALSRRLPHPLVASAS